MDSGMGKGRYLLEVLGLEENKLRLSSSEIKFAVNGYILHV